MLKTQCYIITPKKGCNESEFEKLVENEILPELQIFQRNIRGTSHFLFKNKTKNKNPNYIWMMQVDFVSGGTATTGLDKLADLFTEKVADFATVSDSYREV